MFENYYYDDYDGPFGLVDDAHDAYMEEDRAADALAEAQAAYRADPSEHNADRLHAAKRGAAASDAIYTMISGASSRRILDWAIRTGKIDANGNALSNHGADGSMMSAEARYDA